MIPNAEFHPSSEALERYSLGHLPEIETEHVEEHLLICEQCQDQLVAVESFIQDMKFACREVSRMPQRQSRWSLRGWLPALPRPAFAGAMAAMVLLAGVPLLLRQGPAQPGVAVELSAMRGAKTSGFARVEAGRRLLLHLDATQLPPSDTYRVEIVDSRGNTVRTARPQPDGTATLTAQVPEPLSRGSYWVRLFATGSDPVREYGLTVR